jgi:hypothetical protein
MEKSNKKQSFMEGVMTLLFAQIIVKVLGLAYRLVITNVDGFGLMFKSDLMVCFSHRILQARLRPYNEEEMKALVGKVLPSNSSSTPFSFLVVYAEGDGSFIESYRFKYTAEELKDHFSIDGQPCGVLEHLENGEWVK